MSHKIYRQCLVNFIFLSFKADPDERVPSDWEKYCLEEYGLLIAEEGGSDDG